MKEKLVLFIVLTVISAAGLPSIAAQAKKDRWATSAWQDIHVEEIEKTRKEVESFEPGVQTSLATRRNVDYVLLAVSPRAREAWLKNTEALDIRQSSYNRLDPALDALAAAVAKKIEGYKPPAKLFSIRNAAEERLMMTQLKQSATRKILRIGLSQAAWEIYRNSLGLPGYRFKRGYIWARDTADDYAFCKLYYISIVQDYAGGGRYGAAYAKYEETSISGCP